MQRIIMLSSIALIASISSVSIVFAIVEDDSIPGWVKTIAEFWINGDITDAQFLAAIQYLIDQGHLSSSSMIAETAKSDPKCSGIANCITGTVTKVIEGHTLKIDDNQIRFAIATSPEIREPGGPAAKSYIESICPVGSIATVDEDDGQIGNLEGRIIGVVYCNGVNLNEALVLSPYGTMWLEFCKQSEFQDDRWAVDNGCVEGAEFYCPVESPACDFRER